MSQFLPTGFESEDKRSTPLPTKGPEDYLSAEERTFLQRILAFPSDLPTQFKSWVVDYLAVNIPQIPISQINGFDRLIYNRGTEFPKEPKDGQMFGLVLENNVIWQFRFDSKITDDYKWIFSGGSPLTNRSTPEVTITSGGYSDLTGGPVVVTPRKGVYRVDHGCDIRCSDSFGQGAWQSVNFGTTVQDDDGVRSKNVDYLTGSKSFFPTIDAVNQSVKCQYRAGSTLTGYFSNRWISAIPLRVS